MPKRRPHPPTASDYVSRLAELMMKIINPGLLSVDERREFYQLADRFQRENTARKNSA